MTATIETTLSAWIESEEWEEWLDCAEYWLGLEYRKPFHCANLLLDGDAVRFQLVFSFWERQRYRSGRCDHGRPLFDFCISAPCSERIRRQHYIELDGREDGF